MLWFDHAWLDVPGRLLIVFKAESTFEECVAYLHVVV